MNEDVFTLKLDALHTDVGEVKIALNKLSEAITKLALVEQQQGQINAALGRAFGEISRTDERFTKLAEGLDARLNAVEMAQPKNSTAALWVDRALVAIVGAVLALFVKGIGVL